MPRGRLNALAKMVTASVLFDLVLEAVPWYFLHPSRSNVRYSINAIPHMRPLFPPKGIEIQYLESFGKFIKVRLACGVCQAEA